MEYSWRCFSKYKVNWSFSNSNHVSSISTSIKGSWSQRNRHNLFYYCLLFLYLLPSRNNVSKIDKIWDIISVSSNIMLTILMYFFFILSFIFVLFIHIVHFYFFLCSIGTSIVFFYLVKITTLTCLYCHSRTLWILKKNSCSL